jgi:cell division protein FtsZ
VVDQEANIIVGATFDETLEGIIRVSVVATGIDHIAMQARPPAETRMTELSQKLRVDTQRIAAERTEPQQQARPLAAPAPAPRASVEQAATAAVAAALASNDDVTIRPITPKPSLFVEPMMADPAPQEMPKAFIPPQPERSSRPRMPRIDELPMPAQNEIRAQQGEIEEAGPEKQRMTLLQRLAAVGLGRREEPEAEEQRTQAERPQLPPLPPRQPVRMPDPVSEYAKRSPAQAPQGLDMHGRPSLPVQKPVDDDQLEIPAFLRRQAN